MLHVSSLGLYLRQVLQLLAIHLGLEVRSSCHGACNGRLALGCPELIITITDVRVLSEAVRKVLVISHVVVL